jgi:Ca-activated chloride channel homolog
MFTRPPLTAGGLAVLLIGVGPVHAEPPAPPCTEDAMIVLDASGSMAGNLDQGIIDP